MTTQLRAQIGNLTLEECLSARDTINQHLLESVNKVATKQWGIHVSRVEIQELTPSDSIRNAMELQLTAERNKRATILAAEAEKSRLIHQSEGQAAAAGRNHNSARQSAFEDQRSASDQLGSASSLFH